jgi:hypothetical protein
MSANTIHQDIEELLAADLHNELSEDERETLHRHLVECAECRQLHKEYKTMNTLLDEKFTEEKPDDAFEQRLVSRFRDKAPERPGLVSLLMNVARLRVTQITAVAALLLALLQAGTMITGEGSPFSAFSRTRAERVIVTGSNVPLDALQAPANRVDATKDKTLADAFKTGVRYRSLEGGAKKESNPFSTAAQSPPAGYDYAGKPASPALALAKQPAAPPTAADQGQMMAEGMDEKAGASESTAASTTTPPEAVANRKLIRNANVDLEVMSFEDSVQKITVFAKEDGGYLATSGSEKQANGKLRGQIIVKVLPDNLDRFLGKLRSLGELKNQSISTEDVTKAYFDTESRLKNARVMEQRLVDILKKKSEDINDLLQVEKELGRVREEIEGMQGQLKFMDSQVQFATVTISLSEKDMNVPAAFLLKEHAELSLYAPNVEKVYNDIKAAASTKVQITNAQMNRDNVGRISAHISVLIAPEESDAVMEKIKAMGRVENFQVQTERIAQGGEGMSENAKTERDKVQLNISLSQDEQEQALQRTNLRIRTGQVDDKSKELRALVEKQGGRVRNSSFSRDPNGQEYANVSVRVPMKNYRALMQSLDSLGAVEDVSVQRQDQTGGRIDEANAPADLSVMVYSQANIVTRDSGLLATLRRTLTQGVGALMWSVRMIGVALAFFAPWIAALALVIWIVRRIRRARSRRQIK